MFNPLRALAVAGLCLCLAVSGAGPAFADPQRAPPTGPEAFTYDRPDGWSIENDGGATVSSPSHECFVMMHFVEDPSFAGKTNDEVAAVLFDLIKANPFNRSEARALGAAAGTAYYSRFSSDDGEMRLVLILVRMTDTEVATVLAATTSAPPSEDKAGYDRLLGSVRLQSSDAPRSL